MKLQEIQVSYNSNLNPELKISSSKDAFSLFLKNWDFGTLEFREEAKIIYLNRNNIPLGIYELSKGGISGTHIDIKLIFSIALKCNSSSIILAHNHPSGNLKPSIEDKLITSKIIDCCKLFDFTFLDHLILTKNRYYSFSDHGLI